MGRILFCKKKKKNKQQLNREGRLRTVSLRCEERLRSERQRVRCRKSTFPMNSIPLLRKHQHCIVFGINGLSMACVCDSPSTAYQSCKVASNTRPCSKLGGTTLNEMEEGGQNYISQDLWPGGIWSKKGIYFRGSISTLLQLVVASIQAQITVKGIRRNETATIKAVRKKPLKHWCDWGDLVELSFVK